MARRRALLMMPNGIDTTPVIDEYGVNWDRKYGQKTTNADWCITEWYRFNPQQLGSVTIIGYIGEDNNNHTFQYRDESKSHKDWFYFNNGDQEGHRQIGWVKISLYEISFSIYQAILDDSYAYIKETGQIFFAGKNTQYYGHRNISELN